MKTLTKVLLSTVLISTLFAQSDVYLTNNSQVPDLKMPKNNLTFKEIEGYQNYKIVATHFRTDKINLTKRTTNYFTKNKV